MARLRDRIVEMERFTSLGLLVGDIAHEVYNPLAWVQLNAGLLRMTIEQCRTSGDAKFFFERMPKLLELLKDNEDGLQRIQHVVDALRLMSRRHTDAKAPEDLNAVCQKTLVMLNQAFHKKNVEVAAQWGPLPPVVCAGHDVAQAVMNLLVNAKDAIPQNGHVQIATRSDGAGVTIEVSDDGPGLPADAQAHLFEPFYTTKPFGTGLGLPLVQSVAKDHGGRVEYETNARGGATFRLVLPVHPPSPA